VNVDSITIILAGQGTFSADGPSRQCGKALERAWAAGAGPGAQRLVIDVDSTICQVYGRAKIGAAYGYTKVLG